MSHHSDDANLLVASDSFWEPGNYKRTTKRIEDSFRLCNDLILLIQERSEIEKLYAKSLKNWSKKWNDIIEKGPEYGTTEAAWKGVLVEAERRCEMHLRVKDQLLNDISTQMKQWQKDNFHKSMMHIKEKKEMDDQFKKAQKPWAKLLSRVNKGKADYHAACKNERTAVNQERNASADTSLSPDQVVKKLQDRVLRCKEEVQRTKERYEQSLQEINDYNAKYMEDMTVVFEKCQEFEENRLNFFKEILFSIHGGLNISTDPELPQIYEEYRHTIQNADAKKDLKWWSNNHGVGMAMNWPQFEDYSEEFRDIAKLKKGAVPESGILLVNQQKIGEDLPELSSDSHNISKKEKRGTMNEGGKKTGPGVLEKSKNSANKNSISFKKLTSDPFQDEDSGGSDEKDIKKLTSDPFQDEDTEGSDEKDINGKQDTNPFDDDQEDWDEGINEALVDNGEPGVPVRALYDYEGAEADELSFKAAEVFDKLEDEDEQGWCKGRKDGRVGLYPASYVEVVPN